MIVMALLRTTTRASMRKYVATFSTIRLYRTCFVLTICAHSSLTLPNNQSGIFAGRLWTGSSACPDSAVSVCPTKKRSALDDIVRARSEKIVSKRRMLEEKA